jgi:Uma2 family endonuclease
MTVPSDVLPVVMPAGHVPGPAQGCWTYEHYVAIPDDGNRYEVIDGILYMTPAPNIPHQAAVTQLTRHLANCVESAGLGRVLVSPVDVELAPGTIVQPDVVVILNANRRAITYARVVGAPDLVIEVASPSTAGYDRRSKQDAYARAGVSEYWIADPQARTVELLQLEGAAYRSLGVFQGEATLPSRVVSPLPVHTREFFA